MRRRIRLSESSLHRIIKESVRRILRENAYELTKDKDLEKGVPSYLAYGNGVNVNGKRSNVYDVPGGLKKQIRANKNSWERYQDQNSRFPLKKDRFDLDKDY